MDYVATINFVITIREKDNITTNAACDLFVDQYLYFCTKIGLLFPVEIKFDIKHTGNDSQYRYLYQIKIINQVYSGTVGREILLAMFKCFRRLVDNTARLTYFFTQSANWDAVVELRGSSFSDEEKCKISKLENQICNYFRKHALRADFLLGSKIQQEVDRATPRLPMNGNLFDNDEDVPATRVEVEDESKIKTPYEIKSVAIDYDNKCIMMIGDDIMPVYLSSDIVVAGEKAYIECITLLIGDTITLSATKKIYKRRRVSKMVDADE